MCHPAYMLPGRFRGEELVDESPFGATRMPYTNTFYARVERIAAIINDNQVETPGGWRVCGVSKPAARHLAIIVGIALQQSLRKQQVSLPSRTC